MHTTNYTNTFLTVSPDTRATSASVPPSRKTRSVAQRTYDLLIDAPYTMTSDEVLFTVFADRKDIPEEDRELARQAFFSKGQPCLRCSPLLKTYGWGAHFDEQGRVALVAMQSPRYAELTSDDAITVKAAMRSGR